MRWDVVIAENGGVVIHQFVIKCKSRVIVIARENSIPMTATRVISYKCRGVRVLCKVEKGYLHTNCILAISTPSHCRFISIYLYNLIWIEKKHIVTFSFNVATRQNDVGNNDFAAEIYVTLCITVGKLNKQSES